MGSRENNKEVLKGRYRGIEVWGVAQRRGCLRGILLLHAEILVSKTLLTSRQPSRCLRTVLTPD